MPLERGRAVISKSGRDKDRYLVVVEAKDGVAYVADGRQRRLLQPKRKNEKHLAVTGTVFDETALESDKCLQRAIAERFGSDRR